MRKSFRTQLLNAVTALRYRRGDTGGTKRFTLKDPGDADFDIKRTVKAIYRISDGGYKKDRFPFATKATCLKNFVRVFDLPSEDLLIVADSVGDDTWEMVNDACPNVVRTEFGSGAGSWRHAAFDIAMDWDADDVVYFVEDDYLHLPGAREVLQEGIAVADYVSLYDNRDKYVSADSGGPNHFIAFGGEITRLIRTPRSHWKVTNSTTMTFATSVEVLREDRDVWERHTRRSHPMDFQAFLELAESGRALVVPVPGYSTHCEPKWASPGIDWAAVAAKYT